MKELAERAMFLKKKLFDFVIYFRETAGVWCHF
jgi:hypothetical protein